jgi:hypothetical protein
MPEASHPRHCRHCLGDNCPGDCLLRDGQCIHGWNGRRPRPGAAWWQVPLTRGWWRRVLWGEQGRMHPRRPARRARRRFGPRFTGNYPG